MSIRPVLTAILAIGGVLYAPNLLWLNWSTVRIENRGNEPVAATLVTCGESVSLGVIEPDDYRFRFLSRCGEDGMKVSAPGIDVCDSYVDGSMYHVEAWFTAPDSGACEYGAPPFSPLLVTRMR